VRHRARQSSPDLSATKTTQLSLLDFPILIKPGPEQHSSLRGVCVACSESQCYLLKKQVLLPQCCLCTEDSRVPLKIISPSRRTVCTQFRTQAYPGPQRHLAGPGQLILKTALNPLQQVCGRNKGFLNPISPPERLKHKEGLTKDAQSSSGKATHCLAHSKMNQSLPWWSFLQTTPNLDHSHTPPHLGASNHREGGGDFILGQRNLGSLLL
jgi:hypothetical protein